MNILMVCDAFPPECGGAGWDTYYLVKVLQKNHTITVVSISGKSDEYDGIRVHRVNSSLTRELAHIPLRGFIKKILAEQKFDIINAHEASPIRASVNLGVPVIASVHDFWPVCYKGTLFNRYFMSHYDRQTSVECFKSIFYENGWVIKLFSIPITAYMLYRTYASRQALQKAEAVATASRYIYERIKGILPGKQWGVLYPICAQVDYKSVPAKKFMRPTVMFIGKFNINKGAHLIPEIARLMPEMDFVMIGGTKEQVGVIDIPKNVNIVKYIPNQEVFSYLKGCDVFIAPALWHEPLGRTIMEAMAMSTVPIVSDRGGMQLELVEDQVDGVIVKDPLTPERFAQAIKDLLNDKQKLLTLRKKAKESFHRKFSKEITLNQFNDLIVKARNAAQKQS